MKKKPTHHGGKRAGAGRPSSLSEPIRYTLHVERSQLLAAIEHSLRQKRPLPEVIREALREWLDARARK